MSEVTQTETTTAVTTKPVKVKAPKAPKQKTYHKFCQVMLSGNPVSPEDFKKSFEGNTELTSLMYRLSTYMYLIRKYEKGVIKVIKTGRSVTGYQLVNASEFNSEGFWVGNKE